LADLLLRNFRHYGFERARHVAWSACCEPAPDGLDGEAPDVVIADLCCPAPECWHGIERVRACFTLRPVLFLAHAWPGGVLAEQCAPGRIVRKPLAMPELLAALRGL
jgi:DNA-binding response OmpR family regulator